MIIPRSLGPGAKIAIVSPSSIIKPQNVYNALPVLRDRGWEPVVSPHAFDRHGSFAGTADNRYSDLAEALTTPRSAPSSARAAATAPSTFSNASRAYRSKRRRNGS